MLAGTQPRFTPDDCNLAEDIAKRSPALKAALQELYGINDMSCYPCEPWSVHLASDRDRAMLTRHNRDGVPERLLVQTFLYHRQLGKNMEDNHYAHPTDLVPVVDLNTGNAAAD